MRFPTRTARRFAGSREKHSKGERARGALEAVEEILDRGGDADDVLRAVLAVLHDQGTSFASIRFVEDGRLIDGPSIGVRTQTIATPVVYDGRQVGELEIATGDAAFAERVAGLISAYVLVGWDTSGEPWAP